MAKWVVTLKGEGFDPQDLTGLFTTPGLEIVYEDDRYYLKSIDFDSLDDAEKLHERAQQLCKRVKGSWACLGKNVTVEIARIERIRDDGSRNAYIIGVGGIQSQAWVGIPTLRVEGSDVPSEHPVSRINRLASQDKTGNVERVIHYFADFDKNISDPETWSILYKIHEVIYSDIVQTVGKDNAKSQVKALIQKSGWVGDGKPEQVQWFRCSAHLHRHDSSQQSSTDCTKLLQNRDPMGLKNAENFIRAVMQQWLIWIDNGRQ
jgi:hypothetical protein